MLPLKGSSPVFLFLKANLLYKTVKLLFRIFQFPRYLFIANQPIGRSANPFDGLRLPGGVGKMRRLYSPHKFSKPLFESLTGLAVFMRELEWET